MRILSNDIVESSKVIGAGVGRRNAIFDVASALDGVLELSSRLGNAKVSRQAAELSGARLLTVTNNINQKMQKEDNQAKLPRRIRC